MTSSMGQKRWKESWTGSGRRRSSIDCSMAAKTGPASEVSSLTDYSLERPNTRDTTSFLLREQSASSSHIDSTNYQEKLQGWSAVFHDGMLAPRPGTSLNSTRPLSTSMEIDREISFLTANRSVAFPTKPRELYDPLQGIMPSNRLVSQRKYYVLPSIGNQHDLILRRQRSNVETLNQLDYSRDNYENDAEFFAELIELKRETCQASTPLPTRMPIHPLPPIQKLKDVVRPRTNIDELDEDHFAFSRRGSPSGMSDISDVEEFRAMTPDPDYADTSPRKRSISSQIKSELSTARSPPVGCCEPMDEECIESNVPVLVVKNSGNG